MSENPVSIEGISTEDLHRLEDEGYSDDEALVLSEGLLRDAIPCLDSIYPSFTDSQKATIKFAVLEMSIVLKSSFYNLEESNSPFSSESIGSYSYSKAQKQVQQNESTGVPAFDRAVDQFAYLCNVDGGMISSKSEKVFQPGFHNFLRERQQGIRGRYQRQWGDC